MEIHVQTELTTCHGDTTKVVTMTRGLRQVCPVSPMIDTCSLDLQSCLEAWSQAWLGMGPKSMSLFSDGKTWFKIGSKKDF